MREEYSHKELDELKDALTERMAGLIREYPLIRPLPPMSEDESLDLIHLLINNAAVRILTSSECFLLGQLIGNYRMGIEARMLACPGRYFVVGAEDIKVLLGGQRPTHTGPDV